MGMYLGNWVQMQHKTKGLACRLEISSGTWTSSSLAAKDVQATAASGIRALWLACEARTHVHRRSVCLERACRQANSDKPETQGKLCYRLTMCCQAAEQVLYSKALQPLAACSNVSPGMEKQGKFCVVVLGVSTALRVKSAS